MDRHGIIVTYDELVYRGIIEGYNLNGVLIRVVVNSTTQASSIYTVPFWEIVMLSQEMPIDEINVSISTGNV